MRETAAARERNPLFLAAVVGEDDVPARVTDTAPPEKTVSGGLVWSEPTTTWDVNDLGPKPWWRAQYYYRARWYLPEGGVFGERDPVEYIDGQSVYQPFGYGHPNLVDPSGNLVIVLFHGAGSDRDTVQYVNGGGQAGMNFLERRITDYGGEKGVRTFVFYSRCLGHDVLVGGMLTQAEASQFGAFEHRQMAGFSKQYSPSSSDIKVFNLAGSVTQDSKVLANEIGSITASGEKILIVGHSIGAGSGLELARAFNNIGGKVSYLATVDLDTPTVFSRPFVNKKVPNNVRYFENFYTPGVGLGGVHNFKTERTTVSLGEHSIDLGHTDIDHFPGTLSVLMDRVRATYEDRPFLPAESILKDYPTGGNDDEE